MKDTREVAVMFETRIKICGMRRIEDIEAANACRPDYIGFILSPGFRRSVTPEEAEQLALKLAPEILKVGVFVNENIDRVVEAAGFLDLIQLHGKEDNSYIRELRGRLMGTNAPARTNDPGGRSATTNDPRGRSLIQAFRIKCADDLKKAMESEADYLLLDNGTGTGEAFDWSLAAGIERPFLLAGGLTPENIPQAIRTLHPKLVDISSGVETDGRKDRNKILAAVRAARDS